MTKITAKEFEERIAGDEALKAQVEKITGDDAEKKEKIVALARSLGYEILFSSMEQEPDMVELSMEDVEDVAGGVGAPNPWYCPRNVPPTRHDYTEVSREEGWIWDTVTLVCTRCGFKTQEWD